MLTPDCLDGLTHTLLELYSGLNESIIRDIARRLVKTGVLTSTALGQTNRAQESGLLFDEVLAAVAQRTGQIEGQVRDLFLDAGAQAVAQDNRIYKAAGLAPKPLLLSPSALQILLAGARKTSKQLTNLTKTTALEAQQAYIRACTLAEMQVESGAFDAVTATRNAVRSAAKDGAFVQYPSGHRDRVDVTVRRAVLTGVNQTCAEISLHNAEQMGCDLVEVTAHGGARPEHAAWQGKVFSISGKHPKYQSLKAATGYGTGAGLCGWNCRHSFYPFFEGVSKSAYPRAQLQEYEAHTVPYNGKAVPHYEATQLQRGFERRIRDTRRTLAGYDAAMKADGGKLSAAMQADFSQASALLKKQEARLKDFLRQTGLRNDSARVQVDGFGRSVSQRAVWANKTQNRLSNINAELQTLRENGIIKIKGTAVPAPIVPANLIFTEHALQRIVQRQISFADAFSIADNAIFAVRQRDGAQYVFYSEKGFIAIQTNGNISSVGWLDDAGKKIVEVAKKHGVYYRQNRSR